MRYSLVLLSFLFTVLIVKAQETVRQVTTVQPKIMVIPYTKEGEDIRTILEDDVNKRITLTKIKEAFDSRGFTTVDFTAKLKTVSNSNVFMADNKTDLKSLLHNFLLLWSLISLYHLYKTFHFLQPY